mmetsp:Transcript_2772/g.7732  ORF Transcript_2772/g.7732 Transcript_2772/m.7732 type:complete len:202 (-) Transcript_2772:430-1035(-)
MHACICALSYREGQSVRGLSDLNTPASGPHHSRLTGDEPMIADWHWCVAVSTQVALATSAETSCSRHGACPSNVCVASSTSNTSEKCWSNSCWTVSKLAELSCPAASELVARSLSSLLRLVTGRSAMPQGTMWLKSSNLTSTFRASPCIVTQRDSFTPMAHTLACSIHTPVSPGSRPAGNPRECATRMATSSSDRMYQCTS